MTQNQEQVPGPSPEALAQGYEPNDVRISGTVGFLILFLIAAIVLHVLVWAVMQQYLKRERLADQPRSVVTNQQPPPPPRIQPSAGPGGTGPAGAHDNLPFEDLNLMHQQEDKVFEQLGWEVDRTTHAARIPRSILEQVQKTESDLAASGAKRTEPTGGPNNANTIYPGPPTTQTTDNDALSPQGPGGRERHGSND